MSANGYQELRAFTGEDLTDTITVEGSGSIADWTLAGTLYDPDGNEVSGDITVTTLDADARTIALALTGLTLTATTYYSSYRYEVRRTDAGSRTVIAWGPLELTDPSTSPPN